MKDRETGQISDIKFKKHSDGQLNEESGRRTLTPEEKKPNK